MKPLFHERFREINVAKKRQFELILLFLTGFIEN